MRLKEDKKVLKDLIRRLAQIFEVLAMFRIVHADIKPDNILVIDRTELKICISDLGMACLTIDDEETKLKCGTPMHSSTSGTARGLLTLFLSLRPNTKGCG
jgi:serine/threonine protein kinase